MYNAWKSKQICTEFQSEDLKVRDHLEDQDVDGKRILKKLGVRAWNEFNQFKIR